MWYVVAASVQGAAHKRAGKPNQDAVGFHPVDGAEKIVVAAVADGHGSAKAFRSATGSELAIESAIEHLAEQATALNNEPSLTTIRRLAEEQWPRNIFHSWSTAVKAHWDATPLNIAEREMLRAAGRTPSEDCDLTIYGTTLLACVATPRYIAFLQLGDGDIVVLSNDGVISRPLPRDDRLIANETTSLADRKARDWRTGFQRFDPAGPMPPQLILLSTDGYANSFQDDSGFLQVASDLATLLRFQGLEYVKNELPGWLDEASVKGSGDDVTICIIGACETVQT